jgi:hypothetical protein
MVKPASTCLRLRVYVDRHVTWRAGDGLRPMQTFLDAMPMTKEKMIAA